MGKHRANYPIISRSRKSEMGAIKVSEEGRIFNEKSWFERRPRGTDRGYVVLQVDGKRQNLHRIVALAWVLNPEGHCYVRHKDGNKLNNKASNLEWYSPAGNVDNLIFNKGKSADLVIIDELDQSVDEFYDQS
jgi:hypothetical protein